MPSPAEPGTAERQTGLLAVAGDLVEDIVVWAGEPVRAATDTAAQVFRARGGSGANVAAFAAGRVPTRVIGRVGTDAAGAALVAELAAHGVDVRVQREGRTGTVVLLIDADGERTMFPDRGAAALLDAVDPTWLDGAAWLHVPAYGFECEPMRGEMLRLAAQARAGGARVSLDTSSTGLLAGLGVELALALLREVAPDVLFANEAEAEFLGLADGGDVATSVARTVVVKHGPLPTDVIEAGELMARVDVAPVTGIRDLTGAGDAFAAGFLAATLRGADTPTACLEGHALAASVLTNPGAQAARLPPASASSST